MFTVVIAEQRHLDSIKEYDLFLKPFLRENTAVFCAWHPEEDTLSTSVPDLRAALKRGDKWRAIVVTDNRGTALKNPFDLVQHEDPEWDPDLSDEENREKRLKARFESYEKASKLPLARLMAYLCDRPLITSGKNMLMQEDPDFRDYVLCEEKKQELQAEIIQGEAQDFMKPSEVICLARRTTEDVEYDIRTSWDAHHDLQYSRFAEYNLYYPKMRYLVFDILPETHRNYRFDNVRFLYALLLLACNDVPNDTLQPSRVYVLNCENDTAKLSELLQRYDDRLLATQKMLEENIRILKHQDPEKLSDKEVQSIFCTQTSIPMRPEKSFDETELYVDLKEYGCFSDHPRDEKILWHDDLARSKRTLAWYLKQPAKSLRAAVADVHVQSEDPSGRDKVHLLDELQVGDFREYLENQEEASIASRPENMADPTRFQERVDKAAKQVEEYMETRMTQKTGWIALSIVLVSFILGLVPSLLTGKPSALMLIAMGASIGVIILIALVCFLIQRAKMRKKIRTFNDAIRGISTTVRSNMERYSEYLGHVCSLMKGNVIDNSLKEDCDDVESKCKIFNKHVVDIKDLRAEWGLTFSQFLEPDQERNVEAQPFGFDYRNPVTYRYPITSGDVHTRQVEFLQPDNYVELPVNYIKRVTIRREELYD